MINRWLDRNRVQFGSRRVIRTLDFFMLQSRARRSILRRNGVEITGLNQIKAHAVNHFEYLLGSANLVTTASPIRVGNRLNRSPLILISLLKRLGLMLPEHALTSSGVE